MVYSQLEFWFASHENIQRHEILHLDGIRASLTKVRYRKGLPWRSPWGWRSHGSDGRSPLAELPSELSPEPTTIRCNFSFTERENERFYFFSPLDWFGSRESSPSPLRPLVGELALLVSVKRKGLVKQKKVLTKCSKNIFCCLFSLCLFFSSCSTNQPGLLLSRDNSISGNIALLPFNCLCLQWQPFVVSFIYPKLLLLDSFCSKSLRECIQDPTISPPLD